MSQSRSLQDAKARFSELFTKVCDEGPQRVTRNSKHAIILMSELEYKKLTKQNPNLMLPLSPGYALRKGSFYLSVLSLLVSCERELKGYLKAKKHDLKIWLLSLIKDYENHFLSFDEKCAFSWGTLAVQLESAGKMIPVLDGMIAAATLSRGYCLVTRKEADFQQTRIQLLNPWR